MTLKPEYSVLDPAYRAAPYERYDIVYLSDVPFEAAECKEMAPEFAQREQVPLSY